MLCELCQKREATVHLIHRAIGKVPRQLNVCEGCLPPEGMSESEQATAVLGLFERELPTGPVRSLLGKMSCAVTEREQNEAELKAHFTPRASRVFALAEREAT